MKKGFFLTAVALAVFAGIRPFMVEIPPVLRSAILKPSRGTIFLHCFRCRQALQAEAIT